MQLESFKLGDIWPRAAAVTATALCVLMPAFPALSITTDALLITENSSTSLTVDWNGSAITPTLVAGDHWTFTLPTLIRLGEAEGIGGAAIQEPGASTWNRVFTDTSSVVFVNLVTVLSDVTTTSGYDIPLPDGVSGFAGYDSSGNIIDLTFHDAGDGSVGTVPDHASTAALALISFIALFGAARWFRAVQAS